MQGFFQTNDKEGKRETNNHLKSVAGQHGIRGNNTNAQNDRKGTRLQSSPFLHAKFC